MTSPSDVFKLEEKIGQMLLVGFQGTTAPDYILDWLAAGRIGGVILFARNVESPQQLADLTYACHTAARRPILISIDQEGGYVARLRAQQGFSESPGALALSAAQDGEQYSESVSRMLATEMRAVGINWDYAPVLDLSYNADNPTVGTRSFGADKDRVAQLGVAATLGFQSGGVAACAKHFPGLGNTSVDTHEALPTLATALDDLLQNDLLPYRAVVDAGIASIMTTHTIYSTLDATYPVTLSPVVVNRLLRGELGYQGVVTTDCMEMKAIADNYGPGEAAVLAALGGIDIVLVSHTRSMQEAAYDALLQAAISGRLPQATIDAAVERIQALKARFAITDAPNVDLIRNEMHQGLTLDAARAGLVTLRANADLLPLPTDQRVLLVEFASYLESSVAGGDSMTSFATYLNDRAGQVQAIALKSDGSDPDAYAQAKQLAAQADILLLATRNAHLLPNQHERARTLMQTAQRTLLLCLRNPYDAGVLPAADAVLCTCGDAEPSLMAAVDALLGTVTPSGQLPVTVKQYE
jgi:beta-N-acetylhexosaminidase